MAPDGRTWTDEQFDTMLAFVLRAGVVLSAVIVAAGGAMWLASHGNARPEYHVFHGEPGALRSIHGILRVALQGRGEGVIQLGLLLLLATPIARVVFSVFGFVRQRDWLYVGVTAVVLSLLGYSLLGS